MQERNPKDETVFSKSFNKDEPLPKLEKGSSHQVVGRVPGEGKIIRVDGLDYKVISHDWFRGTFKAKLVNLKE